MIYDLNDNPLQAAHLSVTENLSRSFEMRVECRSGYFLRAETVADLTVEARRSGSPTWTNLETSEIDLSAWLGTRQQFEVRLSAGASGALELRNFALRVER